MVMTALRTRLQMHETCCWRRAVLGHFHCSFLGQLSPHKPILSQNSCNELTTFVMANFLGTLQTTWIKQEACIETAHGAQVAFNCSGCCAFHPDIQLRKKTIVGGWKTLIVECPRCKIEWEERRFQATPPNSLPPPKPIQSTDRIDRTDRPPEVVTVSVPLPDRAIPVKISLTFLLSLH
jgi:hypothetical protein